MKKRFSAVFLALVLCMGMVTPALASGDVLTEKELLSNFYLSYEMNGKIFEEIKDGNLNNDYIRVEKDVRFDLGDETRASVSEYHAVASDTIFTLKHAGTKDDESFIQAHARIFIRNDEGIYVPEWISDKILLESGSFWDSSAPLPIAPLSLTAGQSIQFELPPYNSDGSEDIFYTLELVIYFPSRGTYYTPGPCVYKIDNTAVDTYFANKSPAPSFTDVPAEMYYTAPVAWAVEKVITNGTSDTTFSPSQDCTQAQILTFLYRAAQNKGTASAADMDAAVQWAREKNIIDASFDGAKPCTRATAVSYIWQALGKSSAPASSFTDVPVDADYAAAVSWAVKKGVTKGTSDTTFSPDQVCNRGQIVTFLYRAYAE